MPKLLEKSDRNGVAVTEIVGDMAYVSDDNLAFCKARVNDVHNDVHKVHLEFESSEEFSNKMRIHHRIEEKNGEMKTTQGFRRADSVDLIAMRLQAYLTAIVVNLKRIMAVIPV